MNNGVGDDRRQRPSNKGPGLSSLSFGPKMYIERKTHEQALTGTAACIDHACTLRTTRNNKQSYERHSPSRIRKNLQRVAPLQPDGEKKEDTIIFSSLFFSFKKMYRKEPELNPTLVRPSAAITLLRGVPEQLRPIINEGCLPHKAMSDFYSNFVKR